MARSNQKHSPKNSPSSPKPSPARSKEQLETDAQGKLKPWEAEAIMSADLPSGDPELSPPASSGDQSPDRKKAA